jgi:hypothetical protein
MAQPGTGFFGDGINLSWAQGRDASDVIEVSDDQADWPFRLRERFLNGNVVEADADAEVTPVGAEPVQNLMEGGSPEAIARMAEPAPEVVTGAAFVPAAPEGEESPVTVTSKPTVKELRAELKERGLPQAGKQDELIARLEEDDARAAGASEGEPEAPSEKDEAEG